MTRIIYYACETIAMFIKVWICFEIVGAMAIHRWSRKIETVLKVIVAAFLGLLNSYNICLTEAFDGSPFSNLMLLFVAIIVLLTSKVLYRYPWQHIFNMVFLSLITITLLDFFALTLIYLWGEYVGAQTYLLVRYTLARGIYLMIFSSSCLLAGKKIWEKLKLNPIKKYHGLFTVSIIPLSVFLMLTQNVYYARSYGWADNLSLDAVLGTWKFFGLTLFVAAVAFLYYRIYLKDGEEHRLQQLKLHMLESNYQSLMQVYEEKAILLHDVKNHIQMVREIFPMFELTLNGLDKGIHKLLTN